MEIGDKGNSYTIVDNTNMVKIHEVHNAVRKKDKPIYHSFTFSVLIVSLRPPKLVNMAVSDFYMTNLMRNVRIVQIQLYKKQVYHVFYNDS